MNIRITELMEKSGVSFGTSGARGLVSNMSDQVCFAYTSAFLSYLQESGQLPDRTLAIGADLRPSSVRIATACIAAGKQFSPSLTVVWCGAISSPALALFGKSHGFPTIMVTGSHIPDDRNGLKFTTPRGEITKEDEAAIARVEVNLDESQFDRSGSLKSVMEIGAVDTRAREEYLRRYRQFFGDSFLKGMTIGIYQHSAVIRDDLVALVESLDGKAIPLGRSEKFIPVDTEAIREEDYRLAALWAKEYRFDAIISADGDSDRPLIGDSSGRWLRGDIAGILCAKYLGATSVSTPVSSNTALEKSGSFARVQRTRIGSPYVIAAMEREIEGGQEVVVGYEANGGFLLGSDIKKDGRVLNALPTRDAVIVHLSIIGLARQEGVSIEQLQQILPARFTCSDRIKEVPVSASVKLLHHLNPDDGARAKENIDSFLAGIAGFLVTIDTTDGLRMTFDSAEVLHLRPSGNAPELRCYSEASSPERAAEINRLALERVQGWIAGAVI